MLTALGEVQIPVLAALLLGACATKLARAVRDRSIASGLGPTALFPLRLRRPAALLACAAELACGIGLILTSGRYGSGTAAEVTRLLTGLLFIVATAALFEVRNVRPDIGCGCFGDLSTTPITGRTLARSALLAISAIAIVRLPPIQLPRTAGGAATPLALFGAELVFFGLLSPEVRDVLVRIGYSTPCELRVVSAEQTIAALQRSAQWRRHSPLLADRKPNDTWRELCWRYVAYPSSVEGRDAEIVFAVHLQHRRPAVLAALVDMRTGAVLPWPAGPTRRFARRGSAATRGSLSPEVPARQSPIRQSQVRQSQVRQPVWAESHQRSAVTDPPSHPGL